MNKEQNRVIQTLVTALICLLTASAAALNPAKPPGQNFDLSHWELTLPVDGLGGTSGAPVVVSPPGLVAGYTNAPYFRTGSDGAMVCWCPANGATTSGSSNPRTELRQMVNTNSLSVDWTANGFHILSAQCQVNAVASGGEMAIGQVHAYSVDVPFVILYYDNTQNQGTIDATVKYNVTNGPVNGHTDNLLTFSNVGLNSPINYQIVVSNGVVFITVNGNTQSQNFYATDTNWENVNFYFKAGDYYVNNGGTTNPAQVSFYALTADPANTNSLAGYQWDGNTNQLGIQDGPGVWKANDLTAAFWSTNGGITDVPWPGSAATAVFGGGSSGTAGQISLAQAVLVNAINFNIPFAGDYTLTGSSNLVLADGATITATGGNPAINAPISGADANAGLTKLGGGTLWLGASNTFGGILQISGGAVAVGADGNLGAAPTGVKTNALTLDGGTLVATNSFTWNQYRGIYVTANGGGINVASGQTVRLAPGTNAAECIAGAPGGNLTKLGPGTLSLQISTNNPDTYPGGIIVQGGTLLLMGNNGAQVIGAGGLLIDPGAVVSVTNSKSGLFANGASLTNFGGIYIAGGDETNGCLVLGANGVLTNGTGSSRQLWVTNSICLQSGSIVGHGTPVVTNRLHLAGPATLFKTTTGTAFIVGTNDAQVDNFALSGKVVLQQGALNIGFDAALGTNPPVFTPDQLTMDGGTLQINTGTGYTWAPNRGVTLTANGGTFDVGAGVTQTVSATITGTAGGGLTKIGAGTLNLAAPNTYNGATTVLGGTLLVDNASGSGAVSAGNGTTLGGEGFIPGAVTYRLGAQALLYKFAGAADTPLTVAGALTANNTTINVNLGGTALGAGVYRLINYSGGLSGTFNSTPVILNGSTVQPATLGQNVPGQINLVVGNPTPLAFDGLVRSGSSLVFSGSGGSAGSNYLVLSSTNLALPLAGWMPLATNAFDGAGNFSFTNSLGQEQQRYYLIELR